MTTVVITGANKGIGLELTRQLTARGDRVIAACRRRSSELAATGADVVEDVDVRDPASLDKLVAAVADTPVDVLINNAGVFHDDSLAKLDVEAVRHQFDVNALGPLLVTRALRPALHSGSKVAIITSRMGSIADNTSGGYYGYRMSKAAVNIAGVSLAQEVRDAGIIVLLLHPGMVATSMTGGQGIPVTEAAGNLLARIDAATLAQSGSFQSAVGKPLPW